MKSLKSLILRKNSKSVLVLIFVIVPIIGLFTSESYLNNYRSETIRRLQNNSGIKENLDLESDKMFPTIKYSAIEEKNISYLNQQISKTNITSKELFSANSTKASDVMIESTPYHSEFYVNSEVSPNETIWFNGQEEGFGDVNISKNVTSNFPYYRFNFSETPSSGISNINYNMTSIPTPYNYSTTLSFEFRIPWIDENLTNNVHSLVLELRFNNASINFLFSDKGSSLGFPLEPNVFKPGTNSLYILCNQSNPLEWSTFNYNITKLITSYFSSQEYSNFDSMKTLFCYMFAFIPEYSITLDLRNLNYNTSLLLQLPTTYRMAGLTVFSSTGSLKYEFQAGNFTILISENTSWKNNQITYFNFTLTRQKELVSYPRFINLNNSHLNVVLQINYPFSLPQKSFSLVFINLPFDWGNITISNSSIILERGDEVNLYFDYLKGYKYNFQIQNNNNLTLRAIVSNYIIDVNSPDDISYNDKFQVTGNLITPFLGILQLYFYNQTLFLHQTTLPMLNGSFIFPITSFTNEIPSGFMKMLINWSSGYEFGMYEKLICIHPIEDDFSLINIYSATNLELYQYDPFFTNISLIKNGVEYVEESTNVYFLINDHFYPFNRTQGSNYFLSINHLIWEAGSYNGTIIASDGPKFYAKNQITITIHSATIDSRIENFPEVIYRETDLNFRVITFAGPIEGGTTWPVPNVEFIIWINSTKITRDFTSSEGYSDVFISTTHFNQSFLMVVTVLCKLEEVFMKLESFNVQISNDSLFVGRQLSTLTEISQTPVISNSTYFKIFDILYPMNASQWYTILKGVDSNPISAHLLRDDYALEITIIGSFLIWNLQSDSTNIDVIVLEYSGPVTHYTIYEEIDKYSIHIECYSNYSIGNYTFQLDMRFIEFPISTISLLDFLKHNITDKFDIQIEGSIVFLRNLNILSGIKVNYYLEVDIIIPTIEILDSFRERYSYSEEVIGRWRFTSGGSFSYGIFYSVSQSFRSECMKTTLVDFSNDTYIVEASLPNLGWNSTVSVEMELFLNRGAISSCPSQNYTVSDPYPPDLSYFLEFKRDYIDVHLFPYEPELGSGIESISIIYGETKFNVSHISDNHFHLKLSKDIIESGNISVLITDQAGNFHLSNIDIGDGNLTSNEEISPITFFPSLMASVLAVGYFFTKFLKRRRNQIL
ncbi:MAG: hypothetical protein ACW97W_13355 [Candidatus Hodarchaeales archaeon]|jgi:hypothetical protein